MGQINSTNLPDYVADTAPPRRPVAKAGSGAASSVDVALPQDQLQLNRLNSMFAGLRNSVVTVRSQVTQVMTAVRSGTYEVDSLLVSRSIVGDALNSEQQAASA